MSELLVSVARPPKPVGPPAAPMREIPDTARTREQAIERKAHRAIPWEQISRVRAAFAPSRPAAFVLSCRYMSERANICLGFPSQHTLP